MHSGWSAKRLPQQAFYRGLGLGLLWLSHSVVSGGVNALILQATRTARRGQILSAGWADLHRCDMDAFIVPPQHGG